MLSKDKKIFEDTKKELIRRNDGYSLYLWCTYYYNVSGLEESAKYILSRSYKGERSKKLLLT